MKANFKYFIITLLSLISMPLFSSENENRPKVIKQIVVKFFDEKGGLNPLDYGFFSEQNYQYNVDDIKNVIIEGIKEHYKIQISEKDTITITQILLDSKSIMNQKTQTFTIANPEIIDGTELKYTLQIFIRISDNIKNKIKQGCKKEKEIENKKQAEKLERREKILEQKQKIQFLRKLISFVGLTSIGLIAYLSRRTIRSYIRQELGF